ncbi:MAG: GNAT family N-acetyltransferase [Nanoarchaeota archaeon]
MEIRKAAASDFEELFKLKLKLKNQDVKVDPYLKSVDEAKDVYGKYLKRDLEKIDNDRMVLVAVIDGKIVGCIRGTLSRTLHVLNVRFRGTIDNLFMEHKYRQKGIAKQLVTELISWFKEKKVDVMTLHVYPANANAISLYKKFGFSEYSINMTTKL